MPFIGIIAKESDCNFIKNEIIKNSKNKFEVININKKNIINLKNIKFDTIVISDNVENILHESKYLEEIIKNAKYLIVNSDVVNNVKNIENENIIKYGLNCKADITISSINHENILICIQKDFENIKGIVIEQQEVNVKITKSSLKKVYNSMAIFTILSIYGEILKKI